jgi:DNA processing protein
VSELPEAAYLASLAGLPRITLARLAALLIHHAPSEAVAVVRGERPPNGLPPAALADASLREAWVGHLARHPPEAMWERCLRFGIHVVAATDARFPDELRLDPQPPVVVFVRGDLDVLDGRRCGIVGTRNATRAGREFAMSLGAELAAAGVRVVSGLARGVDGAAHRGALSAAPGSGPPIAVVANGLDEPYPRQHAALWDEVAERGVLISEWPPGTPPDAFRFPQRNRILAALSEVLVVVESRERGGSLITARCATERGVQVLAVPGSIASRASQGTNALLRDGAAPALDADDVLVALGLDTGRRRGAGFDPRPRPRGDEARVMELLAGGPCSLEHVVAELELPLADAAIAVANLERSGWLVNGGGWFERVGSWPGAS